MSRAVFALLFSLTALFLSTEAMAQQGVNSASNTTLPMGAGGNTFMWLKPEGNVGLGLQNPQQMLDVYGAVKVGYSSICDGNTYGSIRYNPQNAFLEYCNPNGWVSLKGGYAFGGSYTKLNNIICTYSNPITGDCSCPSGYTSYGAYGGMVGSYAFFLYNCYQ